MLKDEIKNLVENAVKNLYKTEIRIRLERPSDSSHGDYATNAAIALKKDPGEIANAIKSDILEKVEAKNGFINFFISKDYLQKQVREILKEKESFGNLRVGRGKKINVEFISANPTGP